MKDSFEPRNGGSSAGNRSGRRIGILALQGAVQDHLPHLERLGVSTVFVRRPEDLWNISGIILPGGESTVMKLYLNRYGMTGPLGKAILDGMPVWGICAGAILLALDVEGVPGALGVLPIKIRRNAYGRQRESFSVKIDVPVLGAPPTAVSFIRAPRIEQCAPECSVLALHRGDPVFVRRGNVIATTFHPELSRDSRFHEYFLSLPAEKLREAPSPAQPGDSVPIFQG